MLLGYARVSTQDQSLERQIDELKNNGAEKIYQEKITGIKKDRPGLERLLDNIREGDIILFSELTRLSRSTKDLFEIVDKIQEKGGNIKSLKETWIDTTSPQGKLIFTFFAGISQFERDLISQRTKEGLQAARKRGRKGGRPRVNKENINLAIKMYNEKTYSLKEITKATNISKMTIYRYINNKKN